MLFSLHSNLWRTIHLHSAYWYHDDVIKTETFSTLLALCAVNSPVTGEFPAQRPVTRSFDVFFDLRLNKRLSKQPYGWWFETPSCSLWRHCNDYPFLIPHVIEEESMIHSKFWSGIHFTFHYWSIMRTTPTLSCDFWGCIFNTHEKQMWNLNRTKIFPANRAVSFFVNVEETPRQFGETLSGAFYRGTDALIANSCLPRKAFIKHFTPSKIIILPSTVMARSNITRYCQQHSDDKDIFEVKLTFEMLTVRGQQH